MTRSGPRTPNMFSTVSDGESQNQAKQAQPAPRQCSFGPPGAALAIEHRSQSSPLSLGSLPHPPFPNGTPCTSLEERRPLFAAVAGISLQRSLDALVCVERFFICTGEALAGHLFASVNQHFAGYRQKEISFCATSAAPAYACSKATSGRCLDDWAEGKGKESSQPR